MKSRNVLFGPEVKGMCKGDSRYLEGANAKTAYLELNNKLLQNLYRGYPYCLFFQPKILGQHKKTEGRDLRSYRSLPKSST